MTELDLHKLANTPGAGKAREKLREAGAWNEQAEDGSVPIWGVSVEYSIAFTEWILVRARTQRDAEKAAMKHVETWPGGGSQEHVEIHEATASLSPGAEKADVEADE